MSPLRKEYEVVIVGAGIMGSAAAYFLSKIYGERLLVLEQYDFLHKKGSSHGESRLIRGTYAQDQYSYLMPKAYDFWRQIEKEACAKLLQITGGIDYAKPSNQEFQDVISNAKKYNLNHQLLTPEEVHAKFPSIRLPSDTIAIYSPDAGLLNANKCISTLQNLARAKGSELLDNIEVTSIRKESLSNSTEGFRVEFANGQSVLTRKCVITTGPWSQNIVKSLESIELPLEVKQSTISFWKVQDPEKLSSKVHPAVLNYDEDGGIFPAHEYPNMIKFATFLGTETEASKRNFQPELDPVLNGSHFIPSLIPGIDEKPSILDTCLYTYTPDGDFIIDRLPSSSNLIIGCGFSGHGFKLAPVVGYILAELTSSGTHPYPSVHKYFTVDRFVKQ